MDVGIELNTRRTKGKDPKMVVVLDDGGDALQVFLRVSQSSIKKEFYSWIAIGKMPYHKSFLESFSQQKFSLQLSISTCYYASVRQFSASHLVVCDLWC